MNTIVFDECLQNLFYAEETMRDWIPLTDYELIFEAGINPDIKAKIVQNEGTEIKSVGFIRQAIDAVISMIKNIIKSIKNFFDHLTMSGSEREAYEKFKKAVAQDPKLKNRKITIRDFRKIVSEYDKLLTEVESELRMVKNDAAHPIDNITKKVTAFINGSVGEAATIVTMDLATKIADSNIELARKIQTALNEEQSIMETISQNISKKDAKKFKKDIDVAAKNTKLHRLKVLLFRHKYDTLQECVQGTLDAFNHIGLDTITMGKRALKTEHLGTAIKTGAKTVVKGEIELAKRERAEKRDERRFKKEIKHSTKYADDPQHASARDFIFGKTKNK
jgi:hypothetical protein